MMTLRGARRQDGLDDVGHMGGAATEFAEEASALEGGVGLLADSAELGVGEVHPPFSG